MAEEEIPEDQEEDSEAEAEPEGDDAEGGAAPKKKSKKRKKKKNKKLYVLLGLLLFVGLAVIAGIIAYNEWQKRQYAKQWGMHTLSEEEKKKIEDEKKEKKIQAFVQEKHINRTFFDECKAVSNQYTAPKGYTYDKLPTQLLLGLPKYAVDGAIDDRCAQFSHIVEDMEKLAHHDRHNIMCKNSLFKLPGGYFFEVDPQGRGVLYGHEALTQEKKLIPVKPGKSTIFAQWQFYNVGDGCNVIGYSKMRGMVFTIGGQEVK